MFSADEPHASLRALGGRLTNHVCVNERINEWLCERITPWIHKRLCIKKQTIIKEGQTRTRALLRPTEGATQSACLGVAKLCAATCMRVCLCVCLCKKGWNHIGAHWRNKLMTDCRRADKRKREASSWCCWGRRHCCGGQSDGLLKCFLARLSGSRWLKVLHRIDILSSRGWRTFSIIADCKHVFSTTTTLSVSGSSLQQDWLLSTLTRLFRAVCPLKWYRNPPTNTLNPDRKAYGLKSDRQRISAQSLGLIIDQQKVNWL